MRYSTKDRLRYYFENTIISGPFGVIRWLGILSLVAILFLGIVIVIFGISADPADKEGLSFLEASWKSLMATLDPGTMGGDEGWPFRMVRFSATVVGIFLISILIGIISSGIDGKIDTLRKGKSRVIESNHTLIVGWSEKIFTIIEQIIEANSNQKKASLVILAEKDKVEMEDEIRSKISDLKTTKIVVRSGNTLIASEIEIVNPDKARSIIILSPEKENADIAVIKTLMAFVNNKNRKKDKYNILAEIKEADNLEAAELAGNGEAVFVYTADIIARITAQTCRQSGLSVIYSDLLQFEGDEIYIQEEPKLIGKTYKEAIMSYDTSSIIGVHSNNDEIFLNPAMDYIVQEGDKLVAISEDDDTVVMNAPSKIVIKDSLFNTSYTQNVTPEKTLILGWNLNGLKIINELEAYVSDGSKVMILHSSEVDLEDLSVENQEIATQIGKITDRRTLENIHPENFDHIILLSDNEIEIQESDAQILISLLHLRNIGAKHEKNLSIVSEMRDLRNREIGLVTKADDFIIGDSIISLILSQISENKELKRVFDILFEADGSEIYLKPITKYITLGEKLTFYDLVERASQFGETAIGYRKMDHKDNYDMNFGIKVNPVKQKEITFSSEDYLIVLSED